MFSGRQEVRCAEAHRPCDLGDRAEVRAVEVAPHQRGDDRGHGVRHEDQQSDALRSSGPHGVEREGEEERETEHDRHLDDEEQPHPAEAAEELRIGQRPDVVVEAREDLPADELALEEAQIAGVDERDDEHRDEHDEEREKEEVRRQVLLPLCRTGAPRHCGLPGRALDGERRCIRHGDSLDESIWIRLLGARRAATGAQSGITRR